MGKVYSTYTSRHDRDRMCDQVGQVTGTAAPNYCIPTTARLLDRQSFSEMPRDS